MKKVISIILVLLLLVSLCACGKDDHGEVIGGIGTTTANQGANNNNTTTTTTTQGNTQNTTVASCNHAWKGGTCTAPMTCTLCGATEGEAAGHNYSNATCTNPKTCAVCGATEGEPAGHSFNDATCTEGQVCSVCGAAGSAALGHDRVNGTCQRCGHTLGDLIPLWSVLWCIVDAKGDSMTRLDFVLGEGWGNVMLSDWSTTSDGFGEMYYYNETAYYRVNYGASAQLTSVGDEYGMTITMTNEDGSTGTITIERVDSDHFVVTAVSGTILNATGTAIATVGSELRWTDIYC